MKPRFKGLSDFQHGRKPGLVVVPVNLGTPESPKPAALRCYLTEFLSDYAQCADDALAATRACAQAAGTGSQARYPYGHSL